MNPQTVSDRLHPQVHAGAAGLLMTAPPAAFTAAWRRDNVRSRSASKMSADPRVQTESLARTYERPALRKSFAAFPAASNVA